MPRLIPLLNFSLSLVVCCSKSAWAFAPKITAQRVTSDVKTTTLCSVAPNQSSEGSLHGQNSCFMPLEQLSDEFFAPRIIQIAGSYPGLQKEDYLAVTSEPPAETGQWGYDFSDPDGPQMGTVAVRGCEIIAACEDPVAVIGEHFALGVPLPETLKDPVDLLLVVDRSKRTYAERKFLVLEIPGEEIVIRAYATFAELPENANILGQVVFVQIPWLPCMKKAKSGFMEEDGVF